MDFKKYLGWHLKGVRQKIKKPLWKSFRRVIVLIFLFTMGGLAGYFIQGSEQKKELIIISEESEEIEVVQEEIPWNLMLVNGDHPMEEGYVPELVELRYGYYVDKRIESAANEMLDAAKEAGLDVRICSAYRSIEKQEAVFNESMDGRMQSDKDYWEVFQETAQSVAVPGTSEHALGLALDLISAEYQMLDEEQQETAEAKWLLENCYKYGFILRYPPEKTDITGIIYEPWHYRYVGVEHAAKIMELGITLEEYMDQYNQ